LKTRTEGSQESTDAAGGGDNAADGDTNGREAETREESGDLRRELDQKKLSLGARDSQDAVDLLANVGKELASTGTLDVATHSGHDGTDGNAERRQTKTSHERGDGGSELDQEERSILTNGNQEVADVRTEVCQEITEAAGRSNDGADWSTDRRETEGADEGGDLRRKLEQERLGVLASNGQDLLDRRTEVSHELTAGARGR
jgi:hypothetical protein